ncbi:fad linked oxidase [Fusarium circinatum]|uniref:Fad linked oxidase n=1 Tax=Fusarium circinatum TaxID=48490 RepID=A0A8H5TXS6_FUSCI|nr:fad linked oxidase [Fusarium circinatum]
MADFSILNQTLNTGQVILKGQKGYEKAINIGNLMYRYTTPAAVVQAKSDNDVRSTIVFAHKNNLRVTVKNGGHSYMGYCLNEGGIVLDLSLMNTCHIDHKKMLIHMDAGLIWKDVYYKYLEDKRNIVIGGQCPLVGVSGFTLGAGLSPFSRSYGLGCDNLLSMDIVTWDGECITVSRDDKDIEKKELFWALAGGGGGNFGVTVRMTSRMHKLRDEDGHVVCGRLVWNLPQQKADFEDMMNAFNTTTCPNELTLDALWSHTENKQLTGGMTVIYNGSMGPAREALQNLLAFNPSTIELKEMEWTEWVHKSEGWDPKSKVFHHHASFIFAEGAITRELTAKISGIVEEATKVVGITDKNLPNSPKCHVLWDHIGGATEEGIASDATPFPWRQGHYVSNIKMQWTCANKTKQVHDFIRKCQAELLPYAIEQKAAYINYIDRNVRNWQEAYYGSNYRRLQEIKTKWDPHNVFWNWQSIELLKDGKTVPNPGSVEAMESWWLQYASLVDPEHLPLPETEQDIYKRDAKLRKEICSSVEPNGTVTA